MTGFVPDFEALESPVVEEYDGSSLRMFRDCHLGERCFVVGNGPSLNGTELAPLANEITFGANGIFYMTWECGFTPTYYVVEDNLVFADNLVRINAVEAVARFFPSRYRPIIQPRSDTHFLPTDWSFYWGSSEWFERPRFSHDISSVIYVGQSVTFLSLQLAAYMGFKEIYLVGVDFDYQIPDGAEIDGLTVRSVDSDPNHFHPDYFGTGKKWHLPKLDNVGKVLECARSAVEEAGASIYNATIGGKLEVFPRRDYHELLARPVLEDTNSPPNYLVARALDRAARQGARSTALDPDLIGTDVEHIVDASPLDLAYGERPDLAVTRRELVGASDGVRRLVLGSSDRDPSWLSELLVALLVNDESAFWTRSVLELSPDGESLVIPMLGRSAQQGVGPYREFGIDQIGTLEDSRVTRWVNGRALSLDRLVALAGEVIGHDLSIGVIDGYIYVQSRWKATEHPKELLSTRQIGL